MFDELLFQTHRIRLKNFRRKGTILRIEVISTFFTRLSAQRDGKAPIQSRFEQKFAILPLVTKLTVRIGARHIRCNENPHSDCRYCRNTNHSRDPIQISDNSSSLHPRNTEDLM